MPLSVRRVFGRLLLFQAHHRLPNLRQPALSPPQLLRKLIATKARTELRVFRRVDCLRPPRDLLDLPAQPRLLFLHPPVAHRLVLTRVGLQLRPVDGQRAHLHQARRPRDPHHLHEQRLELLDVLLPKPRQRPMARRVPSR